MMLHFVMLLLTSQPAMPPAPVPDHPRVFLSAAGCEAAAARIVLPPELRLACVPVTVPEPAQLTAMAY
ncbi:MAG: hypothetical protein K2X74_16780 [Acetobacteraceae bacterium]|nr:hypothetical protein [Acetobacteraceae bacterium]